MSNLGPRASPVLDRTFRRRTLYAQSRSALWWAAINILLAILAYLEVFFQRATTHFHLSHPVFWYTACVLAAIFTLNIIVDLLRYLAPVLISSPIEVSAKQKKLLGIKDVDIGFKTLTSASPSRLNESAPQTPLYSPSSLYSNQSMHSSLSCSPGQGHSPNSSLSYIQSPSYHSRSQSLLNQTQSPAFSSFSQTGVSSPGTPYASPLFRDSMDGSGLRSRLRVPSPKSSPLDNSDCVTDLGTLNQFLKEQEEKEYKNQIGSADMSQSGSPSFWAYNRSVTDYTSGLRNYQYQIACRTPQSISSRNDDDPDDPATYHADEVWLKAGVHPDDLELWIEHLRKWLSQTIVHRLAKEIIRVNAHLRKLGCEDMEIGEVSIATLKQIAVTKSQHLPTLNSIIPYLDLGSNQEYLVARIKELGKGGCMSDFNWNGGMDYKGKQWAEHLPTDAAIVMHAFCTYLDSRLPPHPKYPDGKTFTSQHFLKAPDKPNIKKKDNMLIFQSKVNPPHYKCVITDDIWDLQKGRNNMFQAILLFLHHVKKDHGMLGRVNLGLSGINILWVLEKKY
ncbi:transmembrane protein 209-like [Lineus longissimus]|uniref:transmembrane protein 209-like n=1 Tax=Lineus longissimus TaxID=88925 RepID=UPI002B4E2A88